MSKVSINVYINPSCGPCLYLKKWLKEKKINFVERDVINDVSAAKEFKMLGGKFTPTTIIEKGNKKFEIIGAHTEEIENILWELKLIKEGIE